jgi:tetratricopeptide (TPR) repeat protein
LEGLGGLEWRCARAAWLLRHGRAGDRAEARRLLAEVQKDHPTAARPPLLLGQLADREGQAEQALACYRRVLELGDYQPLAVALLLAADRHGDADQVLEQAYRRSVLAADLWRPAAETALRAGQPERACRLARQVVAATRRSYLDLLWLGRILDWAGRHTEAGEVLAEATRRAPDVPDTWLALLGHLVRRKQSDGQEACLAGMREHVEAAYLPVAEARAHELLGQDDQAEQAYRRLLERQPHHAEALSRLAALYLRTDQPSRAEAVLIALLGPRVLVPEEEQPAWRRRLALAITVPGQAKDRVDQALALLEMNRRQDGDTPADRRVRALVRATRPGERAEALRELERLPGGPASTPQERLHLPRLYEQAGDWPRARQQYQALLAGDPDNTAWLALFIEALTRAGQKAEALRWLAELEKREPRSPRTGRLRTQLGQKGR